MQSDFEVLMRLTRERRSERSFRSDVLDSSTVDRLLEVASSAPSAGNRQPYRIMVVRRQSTRDRMVALVSDMARLRLADARGDLAAEVEQYTGNFAHFGQAPVLFVFFFRARSLLASLTDTTNTYDDIADARDALSSAAAAIMQLLLAAHALGLGACWMTGPALAETELLELLKIPPGWRLAAIVPVGVAASRSLPARRRGIEQLQIPEPEDIQGIPLVPIAIHEED